MNLYKYLVFGTIARGREAVPCHTAVDQVACILGLFGSQFQKADWTRQTPQASDFGCLGPRFVVW